MYNYVRNFTAAGETCQKTRCDNRPPKAKMFIPNKSRQFISIDIAYLPKDNSGYNYILPIGDIFSDKFITTVPLKDQTASVIASALLKNWIIVHRKVLISELKIQKENIKSFIKIDFYPLSKVKNNINTLKRVCQVTRVLQTRTVNFRVTHPRTVITQLKTTTVSIPKLKVLDITLDVRDK